jgi:hypothetical protein
VRKLLALGLAAATSMLAPAPASAGTWTIERLSTGPSGGNGAEHVYPVGATRDGSHVLFSTPEALTPDDTDATNDLYMRANGVTTLLSADFNSGWGVLSEDGSTLVFSTPDRVTAADTDSDVDLYKRVGGVTTLLTVGPNGENGPCVESQWTFCNEVAAMSDDGQHVYFVSNGHLAPGDDEPSPCLAWSDEAGDFVEHVCQDVYENFNGVTRLVSGGPTDQKSGVDYDIGVQPESGYRADMARNGVMYFTSPDHLLSDDTDDGLDVYRWAEGALSLVTQGDTHTSLIGISDDAARVLYYKFPERSFWEHSSGGETLRVPGSAVPSFLDLSGDGSHVFFTTYAGLVPEDVDNSNDYYVQSAAGIKLLTRGDSSTFHGGRIAESSRDGRKLFIDTDEALVPSDQSSYDFYEIDTATGVARRVSTGPADYGGFGSLSEWLGASEDGSRAFIESSSRLTFDDNNSSNDIYEWTGGNVYLTTHTPFSSEGIGVVFGRVPFARFVNDTGTEVVFWTDKRLLASDTDSAYDMYATRLTLPEPQEDPGYYVRPAGATPLRVPLVPAYQACTAPNTQHGGPLSFGSCAPPVAHSPQLTLSARGEAGSIGWAKVVARGDGVWGDPDSSDAQFSLLLTNVVLRSDKSPYNGRVLLTASLRLTDRFPAGTVEDIPWSLEAGCIEGTCDVSTSTDAIVPGSTPEGSRAVWQLDQIQVKDGGLDGAPSTNPEQNRLLAVQGLFVP